jgi:3-oxoacyl-[acyl-carrier-protein] synthase-3
MKIDKYGINSAVSIPITKCDVYGNKNDERKKVVMLGFGIGLSWGVSYADVDTEDILPVVFTDYCFEDGLLDD